MSAAPMRMQIFEGLLIKKNIIAFFLTTRFSFIVVRILLNQTSRIVLICYGLNGTQLPGITV